MDDIYEDWLADYNAYQKKMKEMITPPLKERIFIAIFYLLQIPFIICSIASGSLFVVRGFDKISVGVFLFGFVILFIRYKIKVKYID